MIRVRKSTKNTSNARVPDFEALHQLKDFPKDDNDMEFVIHELIDVAQELVAPEGDDCKAESSSVREPEEEHVDTTS